MLLKARYKKGRLTFPKPVHFKHDEFVLEVVVDDDEIDAVESTDQDPLEELAGNDPFLAELWEGTTGTIPALSEDETEARAHAIDGGRNLR